MQLKNIMCGQTKKFISAIWQIALCFRQTAQKTEELQNFVF